MTPLRRLLARQLLSIQLPLVAILVVLVWWGARSLLLAQAERDGEARLNIAVQAMDRRLHTLERAGATLATFWEQGRLPFSDGRASASLLMPWLLEQEDLHLVNLVDTTGRSLLLIRTAEGWRARQIRQHPDGHLELGWHSAGRFGFGDAPTTFTPLSGYDPRTRPWYREALTLQTPKWSTPYHLDPPESRLVMTWLVPLESPAGERAGALGIDLLAEDLQGFLDILRPTPRSRLWLLDQGGQVLSVALGSQSMSEPPPPGSISRRLDGQPHRILRSAIPRHPGSQWHMVMAIPEADLLATAQWKLLGFTAAALVLMLLPILWGLKVGRQLSEDIQELAEVAQEMGRGLPPHRPNNDVFEFQAMGQALQWAHAEIQDRQAFQEQLERNQRLETLETLAGGIAHSVNNHLSAILGQLHLMRVQLPEGHPALHLLSLAEASTSNCARTTRTLLAFSRHGNPDLRPIDLHDLISSTAELLKCILGGLIRVETDLEPGPAPVLGDCLQLEQVLMNLAVNARDAMPEGGIFTLRTRREGTERIRLEVSDTGEGIPKEVLHRIFEPFFTTKAVNQGTGLGLSMVRGILHSHGGTVAVSSQAGEGTRFVLTLNLAPPGSLEAPLKQPGHNETFPLQGLRILVAEDEPLLLDILVSALEAAGANVTRAEDGEGAWEALQTQAVDLVLSDQRMPRCTGMELFQRLRASGSPVPFILASGQSLESFRAVLSGDACAQLLSKPFTIATLLALIRALVPR